MDIKSTHEGPEGVFLRNDEVEPFGSHGMVDVDVRTTAPFERPFAQVALAAALVLWLLTLAYGARQDAWVLLAALWLVPAPIVSGVVACGVGTRRDRWQAVPLAAFLLAVPLALGLWTRTRYRLNEENCGAPGFLPYGWDDGVLSSWAMISLPTGGLILMAGLALLPFAAWRATGGRLSIAGLTMTAASGILTIRCIGV